MPHTVHRLNLVLVVDLHQMFLEVPIGHKCGAAHIAGNRPGAHHSLEVLIHLFPGDHLVPASQMPGQISLGLEFLVAQMTVTVVLQHRLGQGGVLLAPVEPLQHCCTAVGHAKVLKGRGLAREVVAALGALVDGLVGGAVIGESRLSLPFELVFWFDFYARSTDFRAHPIHMFTHR